MLSTTVNIATDKREQQYKLYGCKTLLTFVERRLAG
jgi:hypothetical protein